MKTKLVPSTWLEKEGRRLDCGPYLSGAIEAKLLLERLETQKQLLCDVTAGHNGGVYNGPHFERTYVSEPKYGVPFLSSSSMLWSDLSRVDLLSRREALSPRLGFLRILPGMTLISCSGTVGRMVYARPDMDGFWSSQHVMKVVPNTSRILPGYLYAFLASRYGIPMVAGGTYGAIIQHIEPEHILDLPIPRLPDDVEKKAHDLIEQSAALRVAAASTILKARQAFFDLLEGVETPRNPRITLTRASNIMERFDAAYHDPVASVVESRIRSSRFTTIGEFCSQVFLPGIFKRIHADDVQYGAPYYLGMSLFWLEPLPKAILSRRSSLFEDVLLQKDTILLQAFGQLGGLIGRLAWVGRHLDGATTTHMLVRLRAADPDLIGYLWAFLDSDVGYSLVRRLPFGGSIPHLDENGLRQVPMPLMDESEMRSISRSVLQALNDRDDALDLEREARRVVEKWLEQAA